MRRGFSLLELLVVLSIIAILMGLLIPSIQKVRDAAARTRTHGNLCQLGVATHTFEGTNSRQLPGTGLSEYEGEFIVFFDLLPFLEQNSLYREFPRDGKKILLPETGGPRVVLVHLISSADSSLPEQRAANGWGCTSLVSNPAFFQEGRGFENITDGLSNTIMFGERIMKCGEVENAWFRSQPEGLLFGAAPPATNFRPRVSDCDSERVASAHSNVILVGLGDGSSRSFKLEQAMKTWVTAANPTDGKGIID